MLFPSCSNSFGSGVGSGRCEVLFFDLFPFSFCAVLGSGTSVASGLSSIIVDASLMLKDLEFEAGWSGEDSDGMVTQRVQLIKMCWIEIRRLEDLKFGDVDKEKVNQQL
jgi:hypothetical protein